MLGASMAVLDTAAKSREELLYNRYQAGRDVIKRFETDPPYAYVIPQEQHDLPTAAILVEKLLINGIEVHQATRDFKVNGSMYKAGDWVVLMDQPFASLVKELFEAQHYPDLRPAGGGRGAAPAAGGRGGGRGAAAAPATPAPTPAAPAATATATPAATPAGGGGRGGGGRGAAGATAPANPTGSSFETPYDVTGWTLPMQMGVTVFMVVEPVTSDARAALKKIDRVTPIVGKIDGSGPMFAFSHNSNAAMKSVNDILNAGGTVSFGKSEIYAGGNAGSILKTNGVDARSVNDSPSAVSVKKIRVGLYEPWAGNIDEGWTKWILEQFHFPFTVLHNDDVQGGHLRSKFDSIVIAEMSTRQIVEGMQPGTVPGRYAGGIGDEGVEALREFVEQGGTLVTLGNASQFAIDRLGLPVTNVVAGLRSDEFFCSGALLRADVKEHPVTAGLPPQADLLFERNEVFDTKAGFRGTVLASYIANRNPLRSG
jgi:hypothetical protein